MSDLNKYYDNILKKVDIHNKENNFLESINLLQDELDSPYMSLEYIKIFEEKLYEAQYNYNYNNPKNTYNNFSKEELISLIKKNNEGSELALINYFDNYKDKFDNYDLSFIKNLFEDKNISNDIKIISLNLLKMNQINLDINFYNRFLDQSFSINSLEFKNIEEIEFFTNVRDTILNKIIVNEPSLTDFCLASLYAYYKTYFFSFDDLESIDYKTFAIKLVEVIKDTLEWKEEDKNDKLKQKIYIAIKNL